MREVFSRDELLELLSLFEKRAHQYDRKSEDLLGQADGLREAGDLLEETLNKPLWLPSSNQA